MQQLAQLQAGFQRYLIDEHRKADSSFIVDDPIVGAKRRLNIYHDAYRLRIIEALASPYENLKKLLGHAAFNQTARGYLAAFPSTYPNLRWYGGQMADFLRTTLPQHPVAAEMATFEWALGLAFDAADAPIITLPDLAKIPPENWASLVFKFQPGLQLLSLNTNAVAVWKALSADETPPAAQQVAPLTWLIWRQDLNANFRSLDEAEAVALKQAQAGASFGAVCESCYQAVGDDATMQAAQYLAGWLEAGLITAIETAD